jgi:TRAP-type C4-dicarboxylate transport system substrate-binding protein
MFRALIATFAALHFALWAAPVAAQPRWSMATEYPATSISGEGLRTFSELVAAKSGGALTVLLTFDAASGITSGQMIQAVEQGRITAGDAFAGPLEPVDPIFGLSSLPFLTRSISDAKRLAELARPQYEKVLAQHGLHLLYVTLWPTTGLWSKQPVRTPADFRTLSIRAYDYNSAQVMRSAGAEAAYMPFGEAVTRLRAGSLNAVLSSGDGGAGRRLWEVLPHFTEIQYAMPLSIAFVSEAAYAALPDELRPLVDQAAAETEEKQWSAIPPRLEENYARMRANNVVISSDLDPELQATLRDAAQDTIRAWLSKAGPAGQTILTEFRETPPRP